MVSHPFRDEPAEWMGHAASLVEMEIPGPGIGTWGIHSVIELRMNGHGKNFY
jgi:hypothetical protein